ncbi:MAG: hypothetical protein JWO38_4441, partial [Gemmataceae bacterium]|nr:hypothetical protein [Gemmataceae bacterium]
MYYLRYSVIPAEDHPEREELGEGIVNCWIERDTLAEADQLARQDIRKEKWDVLEREAGEVVTGTDYDEDDDRVTYYRQALTDKEVFVYHHCPRYPVYWV